MWPLSTQTGACGWRASVEATRSTVSSSKVQAQKVPTRMQKELPSGQDRYAHSVQRAAILLTLYFSGKLCVEVAPTSKIAWISEELCIGCGICVKVRATSA